MIEDGGYATLSIEGVARRAGVGKQTIYRWWPSKAHLVVEALEEGRLLPPEVEPETTGDIRSDLVNWVHALINISEDPRRMLALKALILAALDNPGAAHRIRQGAGLTQKLQNRIQKAQEVGQLAAHMDAKTAAEALLGVYILRAVLDMPVSHGDVPAVVDLVLAANARNAS